MQTADSTLILGIGNILWADEGFGVRAVEALHRHYRFSDNVKLMDGGTQGIYLVQHVEAANILLVFDAIDYGLPPGTLKLVEGEAVPKYLGVKKMSLHQTGFQEVLAMAEMLGRYPAHLLLVGVQPAQLEDYGGSLRPQIRARVQPAIEAALSWLGQHGITGVPRDRPLPESESIVGSEIVMARYERGRPSAEAACRVGDERVLSSDRYQVAYRPYPPGPRAMKVGVDPRGKH